MFCKLKEKKLLAIRLELSDNKNIFGHLITNK